MEGILRPRGWKKEIILEPRQESYVTEHGALVAIADHGTDRDSHEGITLAFEKETPRRVGFAVIRIAGEAAGREHAAEILAAELMSGLITGKCYDTYQQAKKKIGGSTPGISISYAACIIGPDGVHLEKEGDVLVVAYESWIIMLSGDTARILAATPEEQTASIKAIIAKKQRHKEELDAEDVATLLYAFARTETKASQGENPDPKAVPPENITLVVFKLNQVTQKTSG